jgi:hypothetical protein
MKRLSPKQTAALYLLKEGEEYRSYFFRRAASLVWFHALKSEGYFGRTNNPPPKETAKGDGYVIPHWPILDYLEKASKECDKPENSEYANGIMQIIRDVTRPTDGEKTDNPRTWWYFAKILANLPTDVIGLEDIELVADWVDSRFDTSPLGIEIGKSLLPKLLQSPFEDDWIKAAKLVGIVTQMSWVKREYPSGKVEKELRTAVDSYGLRGLFAKNSGLLGEKCGKEVVETLRARLAQEWGTTLGDSYSYIWRPAIEEHQFNQGEDRPKNVLVSALRDVLLAYAKARPEEAGDTLRGLLGQDLFVVKRIALHVLNEQFNAQKDIFWGVLKPELFETNLRHELFELLKRHFRGFSADEQTKVMETIETLTVRLPEEEGRDLYDARLRLEWLEAIRGQGNSRADGLYGKYLAIVRYPSEHPEFISYTETRSGEIKPLSVEEFLTFSVPEIVTYLDAFRESGGWGDPTEEGLAELLEDVVEQKPEMFENELASFLETSPLYQYSILRAFEKLWDNKRLINWGKILDFCLSIIIPEKFWQQSGQTKKSGWPFTPEWILSGICGLIEKGVRNDEWAFDETHLPVARRIILHILEKQPATAEGKEEDAVGEAMNTAKGRCLMALVNYSLREARLSHNRENDHVEFWNAIQPVF